jgi:hypothetical protein
MVKRSERPADPNVIERHVTVAGFEVVICKRDVMDGRQYWAIELRSLTDAAAVETLLLTDKKHWCTKRIMDFHAGVCALQHLTGAQLDRKAA